MSKNSTTINDEVLDMKGLMDYLDKMIKEYRTEKDAKNRAYAFILARGLLLEFIEFCEHHVSDKPHEDCLKILELYITNDN